MNINMGKIIKIKCENNGIETEYPLGTSLKQILDNQNVNLKYPVVGALVNNEVEELSYEIFKAKNVNFIDITHKDGMRMYIRSLYFVFMKAVYELFPEAEIRIDHSVSKGYYCEILGKGIEHNVQLISDIENRMRKIVNADIPFLRSDILNSEAIEIFEQKGYEEKVCLFKQSPSLYTSVYSLNGLVDYFYGYLVPSTKYLFNFDLVPIYKSMLLRVPDPENPEKLQPIVMQDKMFDVLEEHKEWVRILKAHSAGKVNEQVLQGNGGELIKVAEALHEKKIAIIAEQIKTNKKIKLILVSGPSSSGKTTFSKRLAVQLRVAGLKPVMLSIDNYFVDRDDTPKDENGDYDFEALEAIDTVLLNKNINDLQAGKKVFLPKFDFGTGKRFYDGTTLQTDEETIIIAEGIHALNPKMTYGIDSGIKFKIYISALTQIAIDGHNRVPTTDNRLIRRIIRDFKYRKYTALDTLKRWDSVRRGERKNIFPYQEEADVMFNSALLYELGVLKKHAVPLLKEIWQTEAEFAEAQRLLKLLSYFKEIKEDEIPPTSILREFLGQSSFHY
jgi:uridine kinase